MLWPTVVTALPPGDWLIIESQPQPQLQLEKWPLEQKPCLYQEERPSKPWACRYPEERLSLYPAYTWSIQQSHSLQLQLEGKGHPWNTGSAYSDWMKKWVYQDKNPLHNIKNKTAPQETSGSTIARPEHPNEDEAEKNDHKNNFMRKIEALKEEIKKSLKEVKEQTKKKVEDISKSLKNNNNNKK